jgi:cytochrome P450
MLDANAYRKTRTVPDLTQLHHEGFTIIFADANTVADTMLMGSYHMMQSAGLLQRLRNELLTVWPDLDVRPVLADLEKLPLLTATIKESLRFIPSGVSLTRIVPSGGIVLAGRDTWRHNRRHGNLACASIRRDLHQPTCIQAGKVARRRQ